LPDALAFRPRRVEAALLGTLALLAACGDLPPPRSHADGKARIVSLVPTATEILFSLGAGDRVVGRSSYCDWPPAAESLPAVGDALSANVEKILALSPTVVLVGSRGQADALAALEPAVRLERMSPDSVRELMRCVLRLGELTGRNRAAEALLASISEALGPGSEAPLRTRPRVLFVVQHDPLMVAGSGSYVHELLDAAGATNAAGDLSAAWPVLSLEALVARDPDVILDASVAPERSGDGDLRFWSDFETLSAVRDARVRRVDDPACVRLGPRLPEAVARLRRLIREALE
jgi:iron complex transport system substrate-binding protein